MEVLSFLAPIAFVFSLSALAQVNKLKEKVESLQAELEELKSVK